MRLPNIFLNSETIAWYANGCLSSAYHRNVATRSFTRFTSSSTSFSAGSRNPELQVIFNFIAFLLVRFPPPNQGDPVYFYRVVKIMREKFIIP